MNFSYWELKEWFTNNDFVIIGSGIVGLNCALQLKRTYPIAKILVVDKGVLPQGASTKNAGFACFGSVSELVQDLQNHTEEEVFNLVKKRWNGLSTLRKLIGDKGLDYQNNKGYELFFEKEKFRVCEKEITQLNKLLKPLFKDNVYSISNNRFQFQNITSSYIVNQFEGQIDTGKMMLSMQEMATKKGIKILNNIKVDEFQEGNNQVFIKTNIGEIASKKLFIATNGFSEMFLKEDINPARAQVLVTKPIKNLHIKGTFHFDRGYYYFRNIDNRILFGGGRNLDLETEETTEFGQTKIVQNKLEEFLKNVILPETPFEIEHRWSGIMGVGEQKTPIVKQISENTFCGIRLGGMGIAIGAEVGKELAKMLD